MVSTRRGRGGSAQDGERGGWLAPPPHRPSSRLSQNSFPLDLTEDEIIGGRDIQNPRPAQSAALLSQESVRVPRSGFRTQSNIYTGVKRTHNLDTGFDAFANPPKRPATASAIGGYNVTRPQPQTKPSLAVRAEKIVGEVTELVANATDQVNTQQNLAKLQTTLVSQKKEEIKQLKADLARARTESEQERELKFKKVADEMVKTEAVKAIVKRKDKEIEELKADAARARTDLELEQSQVRKAIKLEEQDAKIVEAAKALAGCAGRDFSTRLDDLMKTLEDTK